jgi:hypothetical protein
LRLHDAQLVLHAQERAEHVGVEHRCVAVRRLLGHRAGLAFGAGVVDGDIQAAEARDGPVDEITHVVLAPHIGLNERRLLCAAPAQFSFQCPAFSFTAAGRDDGCAFLGKSQRRGAADAGQSAGDEDDGSAHFHCPLNFSAG